jgi:hypothetical protein
MKDYHNVSFMGQTEEEWPESCGYVLVSEFMIHRKTAYIKSERKLFTTY